MPTSGHSLFYRILGILNKCIAEIKDLFLSVITHHNQHLLEKKLAAKGLSVDNFKDDSTAETKPAEDDDDTEYEVVIPEASNPNVEKILKITEQNAFKFLERTEVHEASLLGAKDIERYSEVIKTQRSIDNRTLTNASSWHNPTLTKEDGT